MFMFRGRRGISLQANVVASLVMLAIYLFSGSGGSQEPVERIAEPSGSSAPVEVSLGDIDRLRGNVAGKTIILDPGHGGTNPGAVGIGPKAEKDVVLGIAHDLQAMLEYAGAKVVMTRTGDYDPGFGRLSQLTARAKTANSTGGDVFVSIHANWHKDSSIRGAETYYYTNGGKRLADSIQGHLIGQTSAPSLGTKHGDFYVLRSTQMPAVLVEVGFVSNSQEAQLLAAHEYQEKAARGIYYGLEQYFAN